MGTPGRKRMRSLNWDEEEKALLREIITSKIDVIENKDTSTNTNSKKKAAWQDVLSNFNSLNRRERDLTQIVNQWRNTKIGLKKRDSAYRRARLATGGGPPPPSPPPEDVAIMNAIPHEFFVDDNLFDSDGIFKNAATKKDVVIDLVTAIAGDHNTTTEEVEKNTQQITETDSQSATASKYCDDTIQTNEQTSTDKIAKSRKVAKRKSKGENYEWQLFLIAKAAREKAMEEATEEHQMRMKILSLEMEYWKNKVENNKSCTE